MDIKYRFKEIGSYKIGSVRVAVAKLIGSDLLGIMEFDLKLPMVPEGIDPVQVAIEKHRDELRW